MSESIRGYQMDRPASGETSKAGSKGDLATGVVVATAPEDDVYDTALRPLVKDSFSYLSVFSLAFATINSWVAIIYGLSSGLASGGPTTLVYGLMYATVCTMATVLSHGEMFAVFPTAGGQYHWTAMVSSPRWRAVVSWTTGMTDVIGLWIAIASAAYLCTITIISMILVNHPEAVITPGIQYGIFAAMTIITTVSALGVGNRVNRKLEQSLMVLSFAAVVAIAVAILAIASPKASSGFVFAGVNNATGYDSMVIAWLIGLLQSSYAFVGFDIVYHVSEEMPNAKRDGPKAANWTILMSGLSSWVIVIAILYGISDIDRVLNTPYVLGFTQIALDATGSKAATTAMLLILLVLFSNAPRACCIGVSRTLLAFARDDMMPYADWFTVVKLGEPIWGVVISVIIALALGLVQFGPSAAFNSLIGGTVVFSFVSYTIPCLCMLLGGRQRLNKMAPNRLHNLGRWGVVCNIVAVFFVAQSIVIYCFPASVPVTPGGMNYVVVYSAFFIIMMIGIWYGYAKKRYTGPRNDLLEELLRDETE